MKSALKVVIFISSIFFLSGCYTLKPYGKVSNPDDNKRWRVKDAHFVQKSNALGLTVNLSIIGTGAYLGYKSDLIQKQVGNEKQANNIANTALGAFTGLSISYLLNQMMGVNTVKRVADPNDWLRKADKNYIYLKGEPNNFYAIHQSSENNFIVKGAVDIFDYTSAFPRGSKLDSILLASLQYCSRSEIKNLIEKFPKAGVVDQLKYNYVNSAPNIVDLFSAKNELPGFDYDFQTNALEWVNNMSDFDIYYKHFPAAHLPDSKLDLIIANETNQALFPDFINRIEYAGHSILMNAKQQYILLSGSLNALKKSIAKYPDAFQTHFPDFTNFKNSLAFYELLILNAGLAVQQEYEESFLSAYIPYAKGNKLEVLQFFKGSPYKYDLLKGENLIKALGLSLTNGERTCYYLSGNYAQASGYIFEGDGLTYYKGEMQNDQKYGTGTEYTRYTSHNGKWKDDLKNGYGELEDLFLKYRYKGDFKHNKFNGQGTIIYHANNLINPEWDWFTGKFEDGEMHGAGELRLRDGWRLLGNYVEGSREGVFTLKKWILGGFAADEDVLIYKNNEIIEHREGKREMTGVIEFIGRSLAASSYSNSDQQYTNEKPTNNTDVVQSVPIEKSNKCKIESINESQSYFDNCPAPSLKEGDKCLYVKFENGDCNAIFFRPSRGKWYISNQWIMDYEKKEYDTREEAIIELVRQCEEE